MLIQERLDENVFLGITSLLNLLSVSPTSHDYENFVVVPKEVSLPLDDNLSEASSFLSQGWQQMNFESSESSEDEDEDSFVENVLNSTGECVDKILIAKDANKVVELDAFKNQSMQLVPPKVEDGRISFHDKCKLLSLAKADMGMMSDEVVLHETHVIRLSLLALFGGSEFDPRSITLSHLSSRSFSKILNGCMETARQLSFIRTYCGTIGYQDCLTKQFLKTALLKSICLYEKEFTTVERKIQGIGFCREFENVPYTLLRFNLWLRPFRCSIESVYKVIEDIKRISFTSLRAHVKSVLDKLYNASKTELVLPRAFKPLTRIFLETSLPHISITNTLIETGNLDDPHSEYCIYVNEDNKVSMSNVPLLLKPVARKIQECASSLRLFQPPSDLNVPIEFDVMSDIGCCLEILLQNQLYELINARHKQINKLTMSSVLGKFDILGHLKSLRSLYFMWNETMVSQFLSDCFHGIDRDIPLQSDELTNALSDYLDAGHVKNRLLPGAFRSSEVEDILTGLLSSDVDEEMNLKVSYKACTANNIHSLDHLRVECSVASPLNIIIDAHALSIYQAVFRFLAQIKRTKTVLNHLHHSMRHLSLTKWSTYKSKASHGLSIMLADHLHFVNNLHAYAMHRVVDVSWSKYLYLSQQAQSVMELHDHHRNYLQKICTQCLISTETPNKPTPAMQAVLELLDSSLRLRSQYVLWITRDSEDASSKSVFRQIQVTHSRFRQAYKFLLTILTNRTASGGAMHLEEVLVRLDFNQSFGK